jgi:hypothetical protein
LRYSVSTFIVMKYEQENATTTVNHSTFRATVRELLLHSIFTIRKILKS